MPAKKKTSYKINVEVPDYIKEFFNTNFGITSYNSFSGYMAWLFTKFLETPGKFPLDENDIINYTLDNQRQSVILTFYIPASMSEILSDLALRNLRDIRKQSLFIVYSVYKNYDKFL